MDFVQGMNFFLQKCNSKNLASNTIQFYKLCTKDFFRYAKINSITEIEQVKPWLMVKYFSDNNKKVTEYTIRGRYVSLNAFFNYMVKLHIIDNNPMNLVDKPKLSKKIIYSFKQNEIQEILNCYDRNTFIGYRNYTIMSLLFSTGIRKSELLNLNLIDIDLVDNTLHIIGKGNKERIVHIGSKLHVVLTKYLRLRKLYLAEHNELNNCNVFINRDGQPLLSSGFNQIFVRLRKTKASWSTRVSAHTFRHTFAKLFLLNGGDLFSLQKILGHEDISITRIYVDYNEHELKTQIDKFNPLDNTRWQYC